MMTPFFTTPAAVAAILAVLVFRGVAQDAGPPWPREYRARPATVVPLEAPEGVAAAYQTEHFLLFCDDPVGKESLQRFATVIESVPRVLRLLPLPLWSPPGDDKAVIRLCRNDLRFQVMGGPAGTPGFYSGRKQEVLIRADVYLNAPRAQASRLMPKPYEDLLVHELTHLGMHGVLAKSRPWFFEGIAEYVSAAHRNGGNYSFSDMDRSIRDHVRRHLPPGEDGSIPLPSLAVLMGKTSRQWSATNDRSEGRDAVRQYAAALLLVHYHFHGLERRAEVRRYLGHLAAYRDFRKPLPQLATEPPAEIETRLQRYWFPKGLNLKFAKAARQGEVP